MNTFASNFTHKFSTGGTIEKIHKMLSYRREAALQGAL